ncbi:efflux transporter outer membrane subunit [Methylomonas sp. AM2-LC]|uniref:efflux transporter outer membrane subunit n=1 Tax=Methylomonas sp. AM2-LC TaxID=3153301 RepID=UPI003265F4B8
MLKIQFTDTISATFGRLAVFRLQSLTFAIMAITLGSGCSQMPERSSDEMAFIVPKQWNDTTDAQPTEFLGWLNTFNDSVLIDLVNQGLSSNFDLLSTAARVDAAKEQAVIVGAGRLPQLFFLPGYQSAKDFQNVEAGQFDALFNLNWEVDVWGRIKASQQASSEDAFAVAEDYRFARLSLSARIAQVYFQWREAGLQANVASQSVKDRSKIVALVRGRFNKGLTRGLDLRLALTDLANAKAQSADAHNNVQILHKQLQTLLGHYPSFSVQGLNASKENFSATIFNHLPEPPATLAEGLPSELLNRRPDLIAALHRLQAADQRLASSKKALLPRVTLTAVGGTSSPALTEIIDPRSAAWNLIAGLAQPLFTGGRLQADIRLKEANVTEAYNLYQNLALNAFREVEQALAAESRLREQEQALREAVSQTEASRKLAVYSYRQGLIEILTLLDSYRSTLNAQSAHLAVQRQLLTNRISLYLALGGKV